MSRRIEARFAELRRAGRAGLVTFLVAGDPDMTTFEEILAGLPAAGADIIEIGMPFSDPMADGPSVQAGYLRALEAGTKLRRILPAVRRFRARDDETPIVLMGYYNPIWNYGRLQFLEDARAAGVDGLIVVDLPPEEDAELCLPARERDLAFIRLATPTTDDARLPKVLANSSGFLYYVSITGITGADAGGRGGGPHPRPHRSADRRRFRHPRARPGGGDRASRRRRGGGLRPRRSRRPPSRPGGTRDTAARPRRPRQGARAGRRHCRSEPLVNWLTNYVRPRIRALVERNKVEVPENLWNQCPACERMIFHRDLEANQRVCPHCNHHMRVGPGYRFRSLFGEDGYEPLAMPKAPVDPLKFRDLKRYTDRLKEAQTRTKAQDALEAAAGMLGEMPVVCAVMNFAFMGGSMGAAVGEGFVSAAREAIRRRAAFVAFTASGGARMQEGAVSLMQMARTTVAVQELREAGLPYIVVLTDPTTGGVTASFAMLGDIHIAEPGAVIGFAGTRVIEQTIREKLPEGFQRAEYLLEHGMVDMVVHRFELRNVLERVIGILLRSRVEYAEPESDPAPELAEEPAEPVTELREAADD